MAWVKTLDQQVRATKQKVEAGNNLFHESTSIDNPTHIENVTKYRFPDGHIGARYGQEILQQG